MEIMIRKVERRDLESVAHLSGQLGYPVSVSLLEQKFPQLMVRDDHAMWVAELLGQVVGYLHARVLLDWTEPDALEVVALVVDESVRGKMIGRQLMQQAEEWAKSKSLTLVVLSSNVIRERAHRFYVGLGYRPVKTAVWFVKKLG